MGEHLFAANHPLTKVDRCARHRGNCGLDRQQIVHQRGPEVIDLNAPHRKGERLQGRKLALCEAERPQPFRSSALEEAQIGSMINAPRKVGVLVVDAHVESTDPRLRCVRIVFRSDHRRAVRENFWSVS